MSSIYDLNRLRSSLPGVVVTWTPETTSTNTLALQMAKQHQGDPVLVLTDSQTAGRGRGENQWWSTTGSLTFSLLVDGEQVGLSVDRWPLASMAVGLAICEAVHSEQADDRLRLKWPNDVYLSDRKLAGVLVETHPTPRRLIIGVGVNVNNAFDQSPPEVRARSVSLAGHFHQTYDLTQLLTAMLERLLHNASSLADNPHAMLDRWRERCFLTGRKVVVDSGGERIAGVCRGVDDDGALLIESGQEVRRLFAGVVASFD